MEPTVCILKAAESCKNMGIFLEKSSVAVFSSFLVTHLVVMVNCLRQAEVQGRCAAGKWEKQQEF